MLLRLIRNQSPCRHITGQLYLVSELPIPHMGEHIHTHQVYGYPLCTTNEEADNLLPELFYPITLTHRFKSGQLLPTISSVPGRESQVMGAGLRKGAINLTREDMRMLVELLRATIATGEEIRIEITHFEPEYPGYPYIDYDPRVHRV